MAIKDFPAARAEHQRQVLIMLARVANDEEHTRQLGIRDAAIKELERLEARERELAMEYDVGGELEPATLPMEKQA